MSSASLRVGPITFNDLALENPDSLSNLGVEQLVAQHDFPGGARTQQTFGSFLPPIKWRGLLSGTVAGISSLDRTYALAAVVAAGIEVPLVHLDRTVYGLLVRADIVRSHEFLHRYECEFWPRVDKSTVSNLMNIDLQAQLAAATAQLAVHLLSIITLVQGVANGTVNVGDVLEADAPNFLGQASSFAVAAISVFQANTPIGSVSSTVAGTIAASGQAAVAAGAPIVAQTGDPPSSAIAARVNGHLNAALNLISSSSTAGQVLSGVVNPDLNLLAAQYYGSATQWRTIASANGLIDPLPIGTFNLLIPPAVVPPATAPVGAA